MASLSWEKTGKRSYIGLMIVIPLTLMLVFATMSVLLPSVQLLHIFQWTLACAGVAFIVTLFIVLWYIALREALGYEQRWTFDK